VGGDGWRQEPRSFQSKNLWNLVSEFMKLNLPRSRIVQILVTVLLALIVTMIDFETSNEIRLYPFYFLPIAFAASTIGRRGAFLTSLLCTILWFVSNFFGDTYFSSPWIWLWNTAIEASAYLIVAALVSRLHESLLHERDAARVDSLTGLLNLRAFHERAPDLIGLCHRESQPVVLAYIDLDHFKQVNDTQGHQRGDEVLRVAARIIRSNLRATDLLGRFGGDEFVALLPNSSAEAATETLDRLRASIESWMRSERCNVTASIGAVAFQHAPSSLEAVIGAADEAMYTVKHSGKNRVQVSTIELLA
jgi:diguanylate cyclase (GGDEF)-like protein